MALCAGRMHWNAVKRGERAVGVARGACRRAWGPARTVRAVARVASAFDVLVRPPFLVRVAGDTGRRLGKERTGVGFVATGTSLVAFGGRCLLFGVAARASERDPGLVRRRAVTGCAGGVAFVGRHERGLA